jgi:hypothetical protein
MTDTQAIDVDIAAKQLDRILGFFQRVESKASFLFALNSAMLGVIALNIQKSDFLIWYHVLAAVLAVLLVVMSLIFVYRCIFPSLKGGHASLIYFRAVASTREAEYVNAFKSLSQEQLIDDLLAQAWRNAEILTLKFDHIKTAFILTAIALAPWTAFLVIASVNHPQLPIIK